jgi:hypothetical protein
MKVTLTYIERMNLRAVLSQWRGWNHVDLPRVWDIMSRIELTDAEKALINHRVEITDNGEVEYWDTKPLTVPAAVEYEFSKKDELRIRKALQGFPWAGKDRWAQKLFTAFLPEDTEL